jgi:hypothetical protein
MEKNKNLWIGILVVLVVLVLGYFLMRSPARDMEQTKNAEESTVSIEDTTNGSVNAKTSTNAVSISYDKALLKYKDARIQFDRYCGAIPDKMTFKVGSEIMLDNRAGVSRIIKIGTPYTIKPWGFKIVKLTGTKLPTTYMIDCDGQQNVSTVTVQK